MVPFLIVLLAAPSLPAQQPAAEAAERDLERVLEEAGPGSPEFVRAAEKHLERFPDSPRRDELERTLVRLALETGDEARLLRYGPRVLERDPDNGALLEGLARAWLRQGGREAAERAQGYAVRYEERLRLLEREKPPKPATAVRWRERLDASLATAYLLQAQAAGVLGRFADAAALARRSWETLPQAAAAREVAKWLLRSGQAEAALAWLANAFVIPDEDFSETERAAVRELLGETYRKLHGSETGLGDMVLAAYDRTRALREDRFKRLRELDPNAGLTDPLEFTLSGLHGEKLRLAAFRGKVLVLDFWATWCTPCRAQHPLLEETQRRYRDNPDVVFLSINTDEDPAMVPPFLEETGWKQPVYFEDGLSRLLRVTSIPATVVLDRSGRVHGHVVGFQPNRLVDMLTERIEEALKR
ncbi:MAG: redoxin family protein [Bryobacteraceae bacterium]|jgi:thiol-disulfide isomerase/thioredoxin|nr:redoxin family protein [Bryobacteraceae bacterium]